MSESGAGFGAPSEKKIRDTALRVLADPPDDLRQPAIEHAFLAQEVVKRRQVLESYLRGEIEAANTVRERTNLTAHFPLCVALAGLVGSFVFILKAAGTIFGAPTTTGWVLLAIFGFLIILSVVFVAVYSNRAIDAWLVRRSVLRTLNEAIYQQVGDALRQVINDRWTEESMWGLEFDSVSAPTMVGVAIDNAVSSTTYVELSDFIKEHSTSAIGLAGPRGTGKSTLMEQLRFDPGLNCVGVRIPAPRRYEPATLVRLIHRTVATEVLWPGIAWLPPQPRRSHNSAVSWAIKSLFVIGAIALWIYLWFRDAEARNSASYTKSIDSVNAVDPGMRISGTTIFLLVAGGALLAVLASTLWSALVRLASRVELASAGGSPAASLAKRELERLDYSTAVQAKSSVGWKLGIITATGEDQISLSERQPTDADMVGSLSGFLRELRHRTGKRILICIDELDKIEKSDDVVAMINGIKDLFHVPDVHVVVSVSTDAMHSFAARGVLVRDVFDSAFDTVIQVRRMRADESREVLWRRATNFSVPAMMFCHVWSGGHPRDLIRAARACVTLRAQARQTLKLAQIADAVVLGDVIDLLEAAAGKISNRQASTESDTMATRAESTERSSQTRVRDILVLKELLLEATGPLHERIRPLLADKSLPATDDLPDESSTLVRALDPYLRFSACISEFFGNELTGPQWRSETTAEIIQTLTQAQIALSRHPDEADRAVRRAELLLQSTPSAAGSADGHLVRD
jgi:hypothetical protein